MFYDDRDPIILINLNELIIRTAAPSWCIISWIFVTSEIGCENYTRRFVSSEHNRFGAEKIVKCRERFECRCRARAGSCSKCIYEGSGCSPSCSAPPPTPVQTRCPVGPPPLTRTRVCAPQVDCNVICVDWEAGAIIPNYVRAAANTRLVGKQVAMLIAGLAAKSGLPVENVHLIGFSLGAHAAGYAGAELKNLSRITGLDPAGPLFENQDPRTRLDSTDARFVDVIHSNGENLILGGLGAWQPMGHVDYYPNGGRMQKGCSNLFVGAVTDIIWCE